MVPQKLEGIFVEKNKLLFLLGYISRHGLDFSKQNLNNWKF